MEPQEEARVRFHVFQDERFVDLNLYQFGWEKCEPLHQFGPAIRNHFLFHYVLSGRGRLETGGGDYRLAAGQGFLLCPGEISTYYADQDDPWVYTWVEFDGMRARECMTLAGLRESQPVYTPARENRVGDYMLALVDHADEAPLRLIGRGMILLDEIFQTSKTKVEGRTKRVREFYIQEAMGYIDRNYARDISMEEIAEACGLNRSYFGRIFKETMGQTPQQYLIQYRMTKAAELLRGSRISIGEVSRSVGYENQLHFSRAFKTVFGISPREYRSSH
ncbi:MAG: AraC family transcriptional regulator [bacterium]